MLSGVVLIGIIAAQLYAKHFVKDFLNRKYSANINLDYNNLQVNVLTGNMQIDQVRLNYAESDSALFYSKVTIDKLRIEGFRVWRYLTNKTVAIEGLFIENPNAVHYTSLTLSDQDSTSRSINTPTAAITIGKFEILNGSIGVISQKPDSTLLTAHDIALSLTDIKIDSNTLQNKIPFTYDAIALSANDILTDIGPFEKLTVKTLELHDHILKTSDMKIASKYGKHELSKKLVKEHDHISLEIPEVVLDSFDFGFNEDRLFLFTEQGAIEHPKLEIYRDKLVDDDLEKKRLYSQMLRELPIDLIISALEIRNGHLGYEELVNSETGPGRIYFDHIDINMQNISNTAASNETTLVNAKALFMDNASLSLDWRFDVHNVNDKFYLSGSFSDFEAKSINPFLESNMRARARGRADEIYFTMTGNALTSSGEMKMKYSDFEFIILKKNRLDVNKLLTAIGNIFVSNSSKSDEKGYRYGKIEAERDPTKSFFNYLWINVRNGIVSTLTGDGEKK